MSDEVLQVQKQILEFSMEEQLYLLAYIANNVNKRNASENQAGSRNKSYFGALKNKITYIAPDFDETLEHLTIITRDAIIPKYDVRTVW